jgi:hypothetical protein
MIIIFNWNKIILNNNDGNRTQILPKQNKSSNVEFLILQNESTKQIFWKQAYKLNLRYEP